MLNDTIANLPIEHIEWGKFSPTYPNRFKGPAYLYCVECSHFIRLVQFSNQGLTCSDCRRVLAVSVN